MVNKLKVVCLSVGRLCGPPIPHTDAHLSVHGKQVEGGLFKHGAALWAAFPNTHALLTIHGKQVEGGLFKHGLSPTLMHIVWTN